MYAQCAPVLYCGNAISVLSKSLRSNSLVPGQSYDWYLSQPWHLERFHMCEGMCIADTYNGQWMTINWNIKWLHHRGQMFGHNLPSRHHIWSQFEVFVYKTWIWEISGKCFNFWRLTIFQTETKTKTWVSERCFAYQRFQLTQVDIPAYIHVISCIVYVAPFLHSYIVRKTSR